jgi:probable phosphoglycerate mutase
VQHLLQGASDIPLNDNGRAQARAAAPELARIAPVKRIVSSDLSRAQETAQIFADAMGAEVVTDARWRERSYGVWEGLPEDVRETDHPEDHHRWVNGLEPHVEGYESNATVRDRALAAVDELTEAEGTYVVVSHGSTTRVTVGALLGVELGSHGIGNLGNAQWLELKREGDGPWVLRSLNSRPDASSKVSTDGVEP